MIISFAWTTAAFLAGRKTCTRRDWPPKYAAKYREGTVHSAYDRLARVHGHKIGDLQVKQTPYPEPTRLIPDSDFEAEGLKYMEEEGILIRGMTPREWFENWRAGDQVLFVVRFKMVFPCDRCGEWTSASKYGPDSLNIRLCPVCASDWQMYAEDHSRRASKSLESFLAVYREFCQTKRGAKV